MQAVIIIDMIVDFVTGKFGGEHAQKIIPNIKRLSEAARRRGIPVIYACDAHNRWDPEISIWGEHAMLETKGSEIIPELAPKPEDFIIKKRTYSAFFQTELDDLLKKLGVKEVILTGVVTDICVQHTAADAFFRGYLIVIPSDCTNAVKKEKHEQALETMRSLYGAKITISEEIISGWGENEKVPYCHS